MLDLSTENKTKSNLKTNLRVKFYRQETVGEGSQESMLNTITHISSTCQGKEE